ncbi:uncharacterized protein LOC143602945 [Bidens hawaiensis]|uniref:uncharacterized protein LOC143602945 n=1 Tax=Bidens hawaiensis TaxID=980011 RepID=UPI00404AE6E0
MTGQKELFDHIDGTKKVKVRMGNGKKIQVEGKSTVKLDTMAGKHKLINNVQYAPKLDYNLLSVGQLMTAHHKLLFDEGVCAITNKKAKKLVENETDMKIKALRSDRGGEFIAQDFMKFCEVECIRRDLNAPYTPEQNGVSERKNRTVVEMATSMLHEKNFSKVFWGEAIATAIYIRYLSPTRALYNRTPYEVWYDYKPSIHHLKVFGCVAYSLKPKQHRKKFDSKTRKCIFIGYSPNSKAYQLYDPATRGVVISRDVTFDELAKWCFKGEGKHELSSELVMNVGSTSMGCPNNDNRNNESNEEPPEPQTPINHGSSSSTYATSASDQTPESKTPKACQLALSSMEPSSFDEAVEHKEWVDSMQVELEALKHHKTWSLTELPEGKKAIGLNKRVLRYVAGTIDYGIWYGKGEEICLEGYTDSDWASAIDDRKIVSASVFSIGSGVVTWSSKKQLIVALSSTEAEYVAATSAACQAMWLRQLLSELGYEQMKATSIFCDNISAVFLSKNVALHSKSKHIDIKYHYIKDLVEAKQVNLETCHT